MYIGHWKKKDFEDAWQDFMSKVIDEGGRILNYKRKNLIDTKNLVDTNLCCTALSLFSKLPVHVQCTCTDVYCTVVGVVQTHANTMHLIF